MSMIDANGENIGPLFYDERVGESLPSAQAFAARLKASLLDLNIGFGDVIVGRSAECVQVHVSNLVAPGLRAQSTHDLRIGCQQPIEVGNPGYELRAVLSRLGPRRELASCVTLAGPIGEAFSALDPKQLLLSLLQIGQAESAGNP